jgi:hypothetical protein
MSLVKVILQANLSNSGKLLTGNAEDNPERSCSNGTERATTRSMIVGCKLLTLETGGILLQG